MSSYRGPGSSTARAAEMRRRLSRQRPCGAALARRPLLAWRISKRERRRSGKPGGEEAAAAAAGPAEAPSLLSLRPLPCVCDTHALVLLEKVPGVRRCLTCLLPSCLLASLSAPAAPPSGKDKARRAPAGLVLRAAAEAEAARAEGVLSARGSSVVAVCPWT